MGQPKYVLDRFANSELLLLTQSILPVKESYEQRNSKKQTKIYKSQIKL